MNVKLKYLIGLLIVALVSLQGLSAARLAANNLMRNGAQDKSGEEAAGSPRISSAAKSTRVEVETLNAGDDGAAKSAGKNSLLPEGFDSLDTNSEKHSAWAQKVLSAEGLAVKDDIKVEFGEGHGETTEEALKEAMKDVLQRVVGVYVDSDFRVNNDEIIQDEIITHSNGFIDHYKKMDEEDDKDGRGKVVTIKAWVKMRDFANRMKKIAPSQRVKVDGLLLDNNIGNKLNAEALLRKEFENFDPIMDLMEVSLADTVRPEVVSSHDDTVVLRYAYVVKYSDNRYYMKFLPRITTLFDQIAEKKLGTKRVAYKVHNVDVMPIADYGYNEHWHQEEYCWKDCRVAACFFDEVANPPVWRGRVKERIVAIAESVSKSGSVSVREWVLPSHLYRVYQEYRTRFRVSHKTANCVFSLLDKGGNVLSLASDKIRLENILPEDFEVGWGGENEPDFMPLIGLWHHGYYYNVTNRGEDRQCEFDAHLDRYVGYIDVVIDKKDISKIESAEIKLETNNQGE